jgi:hypothetical protein
MIIFTGIRGNTGIGGNYVLSGSYSLISDMLFYTNILNTAALPTPDRGNYFSAIKDDVEELNLHGEMNGPITDKLSYYSAANIYSYTLSDLNYAYNKPGWDGKLGLKYNLRDKIIAGMDITVQGKRKVIVNAQNLFSADLPFQIIDLPAHFNMNLSAEYRYSKILSFWGKFNNISYKRYTEWAYYPTQSFLFMFGFTYSL